MKKIVNGVEIELSPEEHAEIVSEWESNRQEFLGVKYKKQRRANYPDIGDQLDVIWKYLANNHELDEKAKMMYNKILDIKNQFPKPGA